MGTLDLTRWNITLPTGQIIQTADLQTLDNAFFHNGVDWAEFVVPHGIENAGTTPNSSYLRSELRETLPNGDDKEANWALDGAPLHALVATCRIDSFAASGKMIVGQIHGEGDKPPMKLQATRIAGTDTFELFFQHRAVLDGSESKPKFAGIFAIGEPFDYEITVDVSGRLTCTVSRAGGAETLAADVDVSSYAGDSWYWKAGCYSQDTADSTGIGKVSFSRLIAHHGTEAELASKLDAPPVPAPTPGVSVVTLPRPGRAVYALANRLESYRTADGSYARRITNFDPRTDAIDLSALGFVGFGSGYNGTLAVAVNLDSTRTYLKSYDADAQGRRFELAFDGDLRGYLDADTVWFLAADGRRWYANAVAETLAEVEWLTSAWAALA